MLGIRLFDVLGTIISQVLKMRIDELPHIRDLAHAVEKPMVASGF